MTAQILRVKNITVPEDIVHVEFTDGHRMVFLENRDWFMAPPGALEVVRILDASDNVLATFHSKYQYPINRKPFGFVTMSAGWTPQRFAAYWQVAHDDITAAFNAGRLRRAWRVVCYCGGKDLEEIKAAKWPSPRARR